MSDLDFSEGGYDEPAHFDAWILGILLLSALKQICSKIMCKPRPVGCTPHLHFRLPSAEVQPANIFLESTASALLLSSGFKSCLRLLSIPLCSHRFLKDDFG